jgi:hypothetical protein
MTRKDITDTIFGDLRVIRYTSTKKCGSSYLAQWLTECIHCGALDERGAKNLKRGNVTCKTCNLSNKKSDRAKKTFRKGTKNISGAYFCSIKRGAKRRDIEFHITLEYLQELLDKQEKRCVYTGRTLIMELGSHNETSNTASLDRIDSSKGYIEGNVQWVHKDINFMKMNLLEETFIQLAKEVSEYKLYH